MGTPFIGEIKMFGGNFAPRGWLLCQGQLLPISQYETLFNLVGTTYGGDGQETFGLPDLRGRVPIHVGASHTIGQSGGEETVTLAAAQIPAHNHDFVAGTDLANQANPTGNVVAKTAGVQPYGAGSLSSTLAASAIAAAPGGGAQPHENMQPFLAVNFIIATEGVYPSPT